MKSVERGADGFFHPRTDEEVADLVRLARKLGVHVRVRGSGHSVPASIGTRDGAALCVMLDQMREVVIRRHPRRPGHALVEVGAGCNLGKDPYDPTGTSTWSSSLNVQLQQAGFALSDLGGISHQTIGGFLATGSSGGSLRYSVYDDVERVRFVDGTGCIHEVGRDDADPRARDLFHAAVVSMGLLGVVTRLWLCAVPTFNVAGQQVTSPTAAAAIDLFGAGDGRSALGLAEYLREASYARLMWWPQHDFDRMVVWQASRLDPAPEFEPQTYLELGRSPRVASLAGSLLYTVIGNLDDLSRVPGRLAHWFEELDAALDDDPDPNACRAVQGRGPVSLDDVVGHLRGGFCRAAGVHPAARDASLAARSSFGEIARKIERTLEGAWDDAVSDAIVELLKLLVRGALASDVAVALGHWLEREMPSLIDNLLAVFVPDGTVRFQDTWLCGLPMDNQMDDRLWPVDFTELWIPLARAEDAMRSLRDFYAAGGDRRLAYERAGAFACELYAAKASPFWMSPAHQTDVLRVDVFWFALNGADPCDAFFPRFWDLLKPLGARPHWGKVLPRPEPVWAAHYRAVLPRFDDFLAKRAELDPGNVFATEYWRRHLGIV
jgi:hypothetical protein